MADSTAIPPRSKLCAKCGQEFPAALEFFHADGAGFRSRCKACVSEDKRAYRAANAEKIAVYNRVYRAAHIERITERMQAYRAANPETVIQNHRDYYAANAAERRERQRAYRVANPEKISEARKAWRVANPEKRATYDRNRKAHKRGNGGTHTAADVQSQYERQKGRCFYCHKKLGDAYHVDHVIPLSKGGSNGPENLVIACPVCNTKKYNAHPMDFCGRLL